MEHQQQLQYEPDGSNTEPTNANYGGFSQQVSFLFTSGNWNSGIYNMYPEFMRYTTRNSGIQINYPKHGNVDSQGGGGFPKCPCLSTWGGPRPLST